MYSLVNLINKTRSLISKSEYKRNHDNCARNQKTCTERIFNPFVWPMNRLWHEHRKFEISRYFVKRVSLFCRLFWKQPIEEFEHSVVSEWNACSSDYVGTIWCETNWLWIAPCRKTGCSDVLQNKTITPLASKTSPKPVQNWAHKTHLMLTMQNTRMEGFMLTRNCSKCLDTYDSVAW